MYQRHIDTHITPIMRTIPFDKQTKFVDMCREEAEYDNGYPDETQGFFTLVICPIVKNTQNDDRDREELFYKLAKKHNFPEKLVKVIIRHRDNTEIITFYRYVIRNCLAPADLTRDDSYWMEVDEDQNPDRQDEYTRLLDNTPSQSFDELFGIESSTQPKCCEGRFLKRKGKLIPKNCYMCRGRTSKQL